MSLINDVLRDLEERRGGLMPGQEAVLSGLHPSEAGERPARRWGWPVGLLTAGLLLALMVALGWPGIDWPHAGGPATPGPVPAAGQGAAGGTAVAEKEYPAAAAADPSLELAAGLLEEATRGLVEATLKIAPTRPLPGPGRLENLTPEALKVDPAGAGGVERLALAGALPWQALDPARGRERESRAAAPATARRAGNAPASSVGVAGPAASPGLVAEPASAEKRAVTGVRRRPSSSDSRQRLRRASLAWRQGRGAEAQLLLMELLHDEPDQAQARLLLSRILSVSGHEREADLLLREGAERDPGNPLLAMAWARRLADRGELQAALEVLRRPQGKDAAGARYQAFIAALSQRAGQHQEAIEAWRRALLQRPEEGAWQLGLAISLQALGRYQEAARAYRRAVGNRNLSASLREFAQGRLARLEQRIGG